MNCPHCGCETVEMASFCHECGVSVLEQELDQEDVRIATKDSLLDTLEEATSAHVDTLETPRERLASGINNEDDQEREIWEGGYATRAMIPLTIGLALLTLLALIGCVAAGADASGWGIAAAMAVIGWLGLLLRFVYMRLSVHYYLTNHRLVHEHGIFHRVTHRIDVITIDDVTFEQTLVQRLLGVGRIRIVASERKVPELVMRGIDNVDHIADVIDTARRKERERRGLHIESM